MSEPTQPDIDGILRVRTHPTSKSYEGARSQLTKPQRGESFETGTAGDGTTVYRVVTKLQTPEKGWSGLAIPSELLGVRRRVWLRGLLNGHELWASAQPMGDGNHWVTLNRALRTATGLVGDEEVEARLVIVDGPPQLAVPEDLTAALRANPRAAALFEGMSHNHRKEYLVWIGEAKREETRARRIGQTVERIVTTGGRQGH